jgi:CheY-like chemotaxis protein
MTHPAVLYVDDDDNDVVLMRHAWTKVGVVNPLQVATDGDVALRYLSGVGSYANRVAHPMPCLTLIDVKLPKVSGFDLLKWIRAEPAIHTLPVVVLSSSTRAVDVHTAHALRANAYLAKPPTFAAWGELVASVKQFWLTLAQPPPDCALFSNQRLGNP